MKMRCVLSPRTALAAICCLFAMKGHAQPSLYTMNPEPAHQTAGDPFGMPGAQKASPAAAQQYFLQTVRCVLRRYPQFVPGFLAELPGTPAAHRRAQGLATAECVEGGTLTLNDRLLRGALYEAMYTTPKSHKLSQHVASTPLVDYRPVNTAPDAAGLEGHLILLAFADCVTRASPDPVDQLLRSITGSAEEDTALRALGPSLGNCAASGAQVKFSKIVLRGLLAEAAYRLANSSFDTASVGK